MIILVKSLILLESLLSLMLTRLRRNYTNNKKGLQRKAVTLWYLWCPETESNCRHEDFQSYLQIVWLRRVDWQRIYPQDHALTHLSCWIKVPASPENKSDEFSISKSEFHFLKQSFESFRLFFKCGKLWSIAPRQYRSGAFFVKWTDIWRINHRQIPPVSG